MTAGDTPHPRDGDAAEYVLGTLPLAERDAFRHAMEADPALGRLVRDWEHRLAPLAEAVESLAPSPQLWTSILRAVRSHGVAARETSVSSEGRPSGDVLSWPVPAELARLRRSRAVWRGGAILAGSLAAALAIYVALAPVGGPAAGPDLFAVVNRAGELPALVVRIDQRAGTVQVRSLAAETPAERSLELWSIVGSAPPRSLGLVGAGITRAALPGADRGALEGATVAVTVEPPGGSKTGGPTGPVIYSGKLIKDAP